VFCAAVSRSITARGLPTGRAYAARPVTRQRLALRSRHVGAAVRAPQGPARASAPDGGCCTNRGLSDHRAARPPAARSGLATAASRQTAAARRAAEPYVAALPLRAAGAAPPQTGATTRATSSRGWRGLQRRPRDRLLTRLQAARRLCADSGRPLGAAALAAHQDRDDHVDAAAIRSPTQHESVAGGRTKEQVAADEA
jgi:hypothetical protein